VKASTIIPRTVITMSDTTESKRLTTAQDYASLIDKFDTFLFDCDGVIWSGPKLIPGVREVIAWLRTKGGSSFRKLCRSFVRMRRKRIAC
jgi:hypothetical protein